MASWKETLLRFSQQRAPQRRASSGNMPSGSFRPPSSERDTPLPSFPPVAHSPTALEESLFDSPLFPINVLPVEPPTSSSPLWDIPTDHVTNSTVPVPSTSFPSPKASLSIASPSSPPVNLLSSPGGSSSPQGAVMSSYEAEPLLGPSLGGVDLGSPLSPSPSHRGTLLVNPEELQSSLENMRHRLDQTMENYERLLLSFSLYQKQISEHQTSLQFQNASAPSLQEEVLRRELLECRAQLAEALAQKERNEAELSDLRRLATKEMRQNIQLQRERDVARSEV